MGYKTLSVSDEIYDLLCSIKNENESFNDLFKKLIKGNGSCIMKFYGKITEDTTELDKIMRKIDETRSMEEERV